MWREFNKLHNVDRAPIVELGRQLWGDVPQNTMLHEAVRKETKLTASAICAAIGGNKHKARSALWSEVKGQGKKPSAYALTMMNNGKIAEPQIAAAVARLIRDNYQSDLKECGLFRRRTSSGRTMIGASPDRLISDPTGVWAVLEIKASQPSQPEEAEDIATIRHYDVPQILAQMWAVGVDTGFYARHNGLDTIAIYECHFDAGLWHDICTETDRFVHNYLLPNQCPPRQPNNQRAMWEQRFIRYIDEDTKLVDTVVASLNKQLPIWQ